MNAEKGRLLPGSKPLLLPPDWDSEPYTEIIGAARGVAVAHRQAATAPDDPPPNVHLSNNLKQLLT